MNAKVTIKSITHQRNGISGRSFRHVVFSFEADGRTHPNMLAILALVGDKTCFDECYVVDMDNFNESWRGDWFYPRLEKAIAECKSLKK